MSALFERASLIRLAGEPWMNAVQRAKFQMRYEDQLGGGGTGSGRKPGKGSKKKAAPKKASKKASKKPTDSKKKTGSKKKAASAKRGVCVRSVSKSGDLRRDCKVDHKKGAKQAKECSRYVAGERCRYHGEDSTKRGHHEKSCVYHASGKTDHARDKKQGARRCKVGVAETPARRRLSEKHCEYKKGARGYYCASKKVAGRKKTTNKTLLEYQQRRGDATRDARDEYRDLPKSQQTGDKWREIFTKHQKAVTAYGEKDESETKVSSKKAKKVASKKAKKGPTVSQLKEELKKKGLKVSGTKEQLIDRLAKAQSGGGRRSAYSATSGTRSSDFTSVSDTTSYTVSYA